MPHTTKVRVHCEQGNESMQTILIMAVGALILIGVHRLHQQVSPTIRQQVQRAISGGQRTGDSSVGAFSFGSTHSVPIAKPTQSQGPNSGLPQNWFNQAAQDQMPKQLAGASNALLDSIAAELREHLEVTLPTEAAYLNNVIDELVQNRDALDSLSVNRRLLEEEISAIRRLSNKDLQNVMEGIEGRLESNGSLTPVLNQLGSLMALDSMLAQDRKNQDIGRDPSATKEDAYRAYLDTFRISSGMLTDGVIDAATRGGTNASRPSQIVNKPAVQVAIGLAADRAGLAVAESAFPAFNSLAHWLHDNGYSPRPPRFPRDWEPPQVYE